MDKEDYIGVFMVGLSIVVVIAIVTLAVIIGLSA